MPQYTCARCGRTLWNYSPHSYRKCARCCRQLRERKLKIASYRRSAARRKSRGTNVCQAKAAGAPVVSAGMSWATGITTPILERHGIAIYPREWWAPSKTATHIATGRMASVGLYGAPIRPKGGSRHGPIIIGAWRLMTPHRSP